MPSGVLKGWGRRESPGTELINVEIYRIGGIRRGAGKFAVFKERPEKLIPSAMLISIWNGPYYMSC